MKKIEIEICGSLPPKELLNDVLAQYYELFVQRMRSMGVDIDLAVPQRGLSDFWENSVDYLPPKGCLVVARKSTGEIVGCGMIKRLDEFTGELKRVFVTEDTRGTGSGRALIEACETVARDMGLKRIFADTLTPNVEMRDLFPKLGFVELHEPINSTTYNNQPMLRSHLHFFAKDL